MHLRSSLSLTVAAIGLWLAPVSGQKPAEPSQPTSLNKVQQTELMTLIKLVDDVSTGQAAVSSSEAGWETHVLKGVEGFDYVPFTMTLPDGPNVFADSTVYVRVASRSKEGGTLAERSALRKWLVEGAMRDVPRPAIIRTLISLPPGEMPVGGPSAMLGIRPDLAHESSTALDLLDRERRTEEERQKTAQKAEKKKPLDEFVHPFEDFEFVNLAASGTSARLREIQRAFAVPPGEYDLYVAVSDRAQARGAAPPRTAVFKRALTIPDLGEDFAISSVILVDRFEPLAAAYSSDQQAAHPYAIGWTQIEPARDADFGDEEQFGVVFQVLNPMPDSERKPDVTVEYKFHQKIDGKDTFFIETNPEVYSAATMARDFDLSVGHQVFAMVSVPLTQFPAGDYRLEIRVTDNRAIRTVTRDVPFTVIGSPTALYRAAPALAPPFRRDQVLGPEVVRFFLDRLETWRSGPVPGALTQALTSARGGRYSSMLSEIPRAPSDPLIAPFLRGLALLALNDTAEPAAAQFREALRESSDFLPAAFYLGACYAAVGRDREAAGAWQIALITESRAPFVYTLLADALVRLNEVAPASRILREASGRWPDNPDLKRRMAAVELAAGREKEAFALLEPMLQAHPDDPDTLFLAMRVLFGAFAGERSILGGAEDRDRLSRYAKAYAATAGPNQQIVVQWMRSLERRQGKS